METLLELVSGWFADFISGVLNQSLINWIFTWGIIALIIAFLCWWSEHQK